VRCTGARLLCFIAVLGLLSACLVFVGSARAAASPSGTARSVRHAKSATLRIVVRSLPRSSLATVVLSGPRHIRRRVSRSMTLNVPVGVYTISASKVSTRTGAY
jgi:hypothetical protein